MTAAGDVADYTPERRQAIVSAIAGKAGVAVADVNITVASASVLITVTIAASTGSGARNAASALGDMSQDGAFLLAAGGLVLEAEPSLVVTGAEKETRQALILGLALGIGLLLIVALCAYRSWRRRRMAQGKAVSGLVHQQAGSPQFFPA